MFTSRLQETEEEEQKEVWCSAHRCCEVATDLWLNDHFAMWAGHNASTQVSVEACWWSLSSWLLQKLKWVIYWVSVTSETHGKLHFPVRLRHFYYYFLYFWQIHWAANLRLQPISNPPPPPPVWCLLFPCSRRDNLRGETSSSTCRFQTGSRLSRY